nr:DNA ligase 1-like [Leptinotarsa decemlineata]
MEIVQENSNQYVLSIPIAFIVLIIVGAILVFTFGFKSAEQPPFDKLTNEDRKLIGKKRKPKEKKTTSSGFVTSGEIKNEKESKKSPGKEHLDVKLEQKERKIDNKQLEKNKKNEPIKVKSNEDIKNKRNVKKVLEKPVDFDDGNWETVLTKSDKKKKGDQSSEKKEKKVKKPEKEETEKKVEIVINEESKESDINIDQNSTKPKVIDVEINIIEEKLEAENEKKGKEIRKEVYNRSDEPEVKMMLVNCPEPLSLETSADTCPTQDAFISNEAAAVFDELGDVWTETRITKKTSKKKARRDN